jgi:hypothetical protein
MGWEIGAMRLRAALLASAAWATPAAAQTIALPEIVNVAAPTRQTDPLNAGSEQAVSGETVNAMPVARRR